MTGSISLLKEWIDESFWAQGAFLTSSDGEKITLGKGGTRLLRNEIHEINSPVFYLKDFFEDTFLTYTPKSFLTLSRAHFTEWLDQNAAESSHYSPISNDDDLYQKDFSILKNHLKEHLEKVVLISRETYEAFEGKKTILALLKKSFTLGAGLPYGMWDQHSGMIGSTPEVLFNIQNKILTTFALAGTSKVGKEDELLNSVKDQHEHKLVIQDISEKLSKFTQDIEVQETKIFPFKNLIHLKTEIKATLAPTTDMTKLTCSLSPTAALGGYPQRESKEFLMGSHYFQKYPSRYFGSAFGVISKDSREFVVAIRNVQWESTHLYIESGGGVVHESEFNKELEEIHLKRNTIRKHYL
jgi:isochorismate synthase EntC